MAFITAPWEQPPTVHIEEREQATDKHKAIEEQHRGGRSLPVYTEGSAHEGHIGVAAVARDRYRHLYTG